MLERLHYFVRRALRNMRQSPFLCSAAVGTVAVSLTILAFFVMMVSNVQQLTRQWSREVQITAYFETPPAADGGLQQWADRVAAMPEVAEVRRVSSEEAFRRFRRRLGAQADLLEGLQSDVLPASLEILLKPEFRNRRTVETVVDRLRQEGPFDLRYGRDWLERFESFVNLLQLVGTVLGGFLVFATLFIVANTIKLTLYARRDELEVMALVGGTSMFIKAPFLLEGAIQGALGGALALGGTFVLFQWVLQEGLAAFMPASAEGLLFLSGSHQVLLVLAGLLLGVAGSLLALRKLVRIQP